ncbi:hypothetical protein A2291_06040 [candidate division WOR-1 bacterium RIFOXYB2_FULL_42_35]|uniref:Amidase domain-containing protein n=1 Tax=candidate division WOR-1 bacterium RIFOXYC2_FULL_41_25 TaxID=1802586 RepID=A0A1F4TJN4_UNCSA|nr:MAG: hypothetical protein A2247_01700 [candidate division WOR-1 bacterium RIFOXYA2_FULL_41_14]OGC22285.1 MAG: hypothetical protein A2291_06040 [candidate division WOR-1 bacterium RIFOXYB2_FULL_42_35]OGC32904.1 MAG: hypothetical protein A2462_00715 [candidate division WOR-1 bacterium RIFOXYC2_FULL_41_25]OGC41712.1 MAG: hypothetical protein A2548_04955 [candidate division WOR-1 bacterium RIFOXYD2_FULL_41_8]
MKNKRKIIVTLILSAVLVQAAMAFSFTGSTAGGGGKFSPPPPPPNYSFEDLRRGLRNEDFFFSNYNQPYYAKVDLGFFPVAAAAAEKRDRVVPKLQANASSYRVKQAKAYSSWNDNTRVTFDWNKFRQEGGMRGDLILLRAQGKGPELVKIISNWTHIAIVDDISYNRVFESMPEGGVARNYAPSSWGNNISYFTCKKIQTASYENIWNALNWAINNYQGKPYYPQISARAGLITLVEKWSNKDDVGSMYCSKLVYNTFKKSPYMSVNLDSNNTGVFNSQIQDRSWGAPGFSWIGVSPDDIYYSDQLGADFAYSANLNYL